MLQPVPAREPPVWKTFSVPWSELTTRSTTEIAEAMTTQWLEYGKMRPSWIIALCESAKSGADFELCLEAWRLFQCRLPFADEHAYAHALVAAGMRSEQWPRLVDVLTSELSLYRLALSNQAQAQLLLRVPDALFARLWHAVRHRALPAAPAEAVVAAALQRCSDSPSLAAHAADLFRLVAPPPSITTLNWFIKCNIQLGNDIESVFNLFSLSITSSHFLVTGKFDEARQIFESSQQAPTSRTQYLLLISALLLSTSFFAP